MSTVPYIGSKISLVSNSDIRYEGVLYTINTAESTIALQSVRCCGTEGRKVPEIQPSSEIYDFIIFRGQDIKDLTVLESANPALTAQLNDPAIMSVNQKPPGSKAAAGKGKASSTPAGCGGKGGYGSAAAGGGGYGSDAAGGGGYGYGGSASYGGKASTGASGKGASADRYSGAGGKGGSSMHSTGGWGGNAWGGGASLGKPDWSSASGYGRSAGTGSYNAWGGDGYGKGSGGKTHKGAEAPKGSKAGKASGKDGKGFKGASEKGGKAPTKGDKGGKSSGGKGGDTGKSGGGTRRGGGGVSATPVGELVPSANQAAKSKYTDEFDYEEENKKFDKNVVKDEEVDDKMKPLSGYNKGKSFFDSISCEATERAGDSERVRVDRNTARETDRETFGDTRRPPRPLGGRRGKGRP